MKQKILSAARILIFLSVGIFLFWLVIRNQDLGEIRSKLVNANWLWPFIALFFGFISNLFRSLRWNMLINSLGYKPRLVNVFGAVMVGYLINLAIPRLGEISRSALLANYEKVPMNQIFGTVVVERIIDVVTIFFLLFIVLLLEYGKMSTMANTYVFTPIGLKLSVLFSKGLVFYLLFAVLFAFVFFASWFLIIRIKRTRYYLKLKDMLRGFVEGIRTIGSLQNRNMFVLYTVLIWGMYFMMSYLCFFSFEQTSGLGVVAGIVVMVFGAFGWAAPVQGGFGTYHAIVTQSLFVFGIENDDGLAYAILSHTTQVFGMVIFGLLSLLLLPILNRKRKKA